MPPVIIAPSAGPSGGSSDVVAVLASDLNHATNSTTLENITGFTFNTTTSATEVWLVELLLLMSTNTQGGSSTDYKFQWSVSGSQTGRWGGNVEANTAFNGTVVVPPLITSALLQGGTPASLGVSMHRLVALITSGGSAGAVQLQFAQNALVTGAIATAKAMSTMIARKVAA